MKMNAEELKYIKAKSRVEKLKSIYRHIAVFLITISVLFLLMSFFPGSKDSMFYYILSYTTDVTWIVWGFVIVLHVIIAFGLDKILGRNWEVEKISKFMENEDDSSVY
ncbi:2TM domain-containing protein [Psychroserpens sp.]|uniref:2TM domain-containing protein n=1 Tax=Psychroserpens sp. TaxID=2020870 RepID=UPI001B2C6F55|nr:2TM domain-containing protein [Psychroserpens sp.]MBO6606993.1 2TM domain-containing protein [Psychroserpens sp.]MBO6630534.1 2TM domain-containing protein [Psychroserpens sp.]MBO6654139.1 2TM domain-containing protein [Psychroserpens sp.]MBO6682575.1 2TM domain-containing protein [Psychroserpens sp.]MBO6750765.1 2TM domain-containing protein [Psychroserpens sp.]